MDIQTDISRYPSVSATTHTPGVSGRYSFIPTTRVIDALAQKGWTPSKVQEKPVRLESKRGFQKHLIRFRHQGFPAMLDGIHPEIVMVNSHDGTASFQFMAGLFRLVCTNGLILGDTFSSFRVRHRGYTDRAVFEAVEHLGDITPAVMEKVKSFSKIELMPEEQVIFAEAALLLRYSQEALETGYVNPVEFAKPIRRSEQAPTLWNTFNIAQEKFQKGSRFMKSSKSPTPRKTRGIASIDENVRVNKALWHLTEKMAEFKGA